LTFVLQSLVGAGVVGGIALLALGAFLLNKLLNGGSEYVTYGEACDILRKDERVQKEFGPGSELYFYGERASDRQIGARHTGLKHSSFVNPATGNKHTRVEFHMKNEADRHAVVVAEKWQRPEVVWYTWQWKELTVEFKVLNSKKFVL
jgi:hypothetical protein